MPRQLTKSELESGTAEIVRKASPPPAPEAPKERGADLLKQIVSAISDLVKLHKTTEAILKRPTHDSDEQLAAALERLADIQEMTQQTMQAFQDRKPEPPPTPWTEAAIEVTEWDAYGRAKKMKISRG
jgi:ElaB/YqjD/DUF883 family membrane-anchored ribosome-binding protein